MNKRAIALLTARLVLGGVFLAAGFSKVSDPADFADAMATFQFVPAPLIPPLSLTLPFLEIILGAMLLTGLRRRTAAFGAMLLLAVYSAALTSALARHLPLECDCFGSATSTPLALLRDAFLFTIASALYVADFTRAKN